MCVCAFTVYTVCLYAMHVWVNIKEKLNKAFFFFFSLFCKKKGEFFFTSWSMGEESIGEKSFLKNETGKSK